jgi:hypothetical protein
MRAQPQALSVLQQIEPELHAGQLAVLPDVHAARHTPLTQCADVQSPFTLHTLAFAHLVVHVPPQSTSVSTPFLRPSVQLTVMQSELWQPPPEQSVGAVHDFPLAHFGHALPPQSTSVSKPFFIASEQLVVMHTPLEQALLAQSALTRQGPPVGHPLQVPPQSTSVSVPFLTESAQVGAKQ